MTISIHNLALGEALRKVASARGAAVAAIAVAWRSLKGTTLCLWLAPAGEKSG